MTAKYSAAPAKVVAEVPLSNCSVTHYCRFMLPKMATGSNLLPFPAGNKVAVSGNNVAISGNKLLPLSSTLLPGVDRPLKKPDHTLLLYNQIIYNYTKMSRFHFLNHAHNKLTVQG